MDYIFLVGITAAAFTTSALLPQVIKAHTSRHTKDISLAMFVMTAAGLSLWIVYGLALRSVPVIVANIATLGLCSYMIFLKIKYG